MEILVRGNEHHNLMNYFTSPVLSLTAPSTLKEIIFFHIQTGLLNTRRTSIKQCLFSSLGSSYTTFYLQQQLSETSQKILARKVQNYLTKLRHIRKSKELATRRKNGLDGNFTMRVSTESFNNGCQNTNRESNKSFHMRHPVIT